MRQTLILFLTLVFFSGFSAKTYCQVGVPGAISYQGRLSGATGAPVKDSVYNIRFIIYDAPTLGNVLWNSGFQPIQTRNGVFTYVFGTNVPLPQNLFTNDTNRYLGISLDVDPEMTPRIKFSTQPYVYRALKSTSADSSEVSINAENLGGSPPSFYLDWNNFSSLPPGFADGVDDTATSIDWLGVTNVPAGIADGVDDTATSIDWTALTGIPTPFADGTDDTATSIDWSALTGVPAPFADGTDDGMNQADADDRFVNVTGDTMSGDIVWTGISNDTAVLINRVGRMIKTFGQDGKEQVRLWGLGWGELLLHDGSIDNDITAVLSAGNDGGGALTLSDKFGVATIRLLGGLTGDNSVFLPDNSIGSGEIVDEPGLAHARDLSPVGITLTTSAMQDLVVLSVTLPNSGYVYLRGRATCALQIRDSTNIACLQIDETTGGTVIPGLAANLGAQGIDSGGVHVHDGSIERTYFKSAGTYTFRLEGMQTTASSGSAIVSFPSLTAMYFPTAYGSVMSASPSPGEHPNAKALSLRNEDGTLSTVYQMDLRYYEERARQAMIARQKAELEELRAKAELERVRQSVKDD